MTEFTAKFDLVRAMNPGDQVIGDVRGPRAFVLVTSTPGIAPPRKRADTVAGKIGRRRGVVGDRVWNLRKVGGVLAYYRAIAFIAVHVAVREVVQQRRTEGVIPVEPAHPRVLRIC